MKSIPGDTSACDKAEATTRDVTISPRYTTPECPRLTPTTCASPISAQRSLCKSVLFLYRYYFGLHDAYARNLDPGAGTIAH